MVTDFTPRDAHIRRMDLDDPPWELLLDADPSRGRIEGYLSNDFSRIAVHEQRTVGVYALTRLASTRFELMNIAVHPDYRGTGLGRRLLGHAMGLAETKGGREIEVGTGNSSVDNLLFYQRAGFRIVGVAPDYFVRHYDEPIVENGIRCRDMVRMLLTLTPE